MEYFVLFLILLGGLFVFRDYFLRAVAGKWKASGDQFGHGRQFEPVDSVECSLDPVTNSWYDQTCFENRNCPLGNDGCISQAIAACHNNFCTNN
jgi:hypothetical protein